jgi:choline-sulfatase
MPEELEPEHALDAHIGARVCERIERYAGAEQPFFLWASFVGPHVPFDGPARFADLYDEREIPLGPAGLPEPPDNLWGEYLRFVIDLLACGDCGEDEFRAMAKHYYASITLIDEQIGRIAAAVERAGIADRTWIVFSSDHGELLGDHGLLTKGVFYETSVRVPLVVVPPRRDRRVVGDLVQGIDLVATILELAGADRSGLSGRSLLGDGPRRTAVFSQVGAFTMAATREWKLIVETAGCRPQALYDLRADPDETRDVLAANAPVAASLVSDLVEPYLAGAVD